MSWGLVFGDHDGLRTEGVFALANHHAAVAKHTVLGKQHAAGGAAELIGLEVEAIDLLAVHII